MGTIIKQAVGIDCSQEILDCSFGSLDSELLQDIQTPAKFNNDKSGFHKLVGWTEKRKVKGVDIVFVVEVTGVYHEKLAHFLIDKGYKVSVVLPNRTSNFFKTTTIKTINDPTSARMIAQFGIEKQLTLWKKPEPIYRRLKQLTRERVQLIDQRTVNKNQLHAEQSEAFPSVSSIKRMNKLIALLNQQIEDIEDEIRTLLKSDAKLNRQIDNLCTVPGVALITAATVIGETNGFDLIRNKRQLVSYAGLDVIEKQSGTSVNHKRRISHKGNKHLRKALYFPAFTSIRYNEHHKNHYANLVSKHGVKMKAAVSVQRKMLVLLYTLWKTEKPFDAEYPQKESGQQLLATPTELAQGRS
jgi:transposase